MPTPEPQLLPQLDFTDDDFAQLFTDTSAEAVEEPPDVSTELIGLGRQLTGQYVDVLATFTRTAFSSRSGSAADPGLHAALDSLVRLARATDDVSLLEQLSELQDLTGAGIPSRTRRRHRFLDQLRERILNIAGCLLDPERTRLQGLVRFEEAGQPMLNEIGNIPGIGPKRLERLYCAGLFTPERIKAASAAEISEVTGIPVALAERVVETSRAFAAAERQRCVEEMRHRIQAFLSALPQLRQDEDRELIASARVALAQLQQALDDVETPPVERTP